MSDPEVIVIGGGAAGLFCARTAGLRGLRVELLEHNPRPGNKILISGGGRCNFTNTGATAANYVTSGSPHFMKSALARYTPSDFLALVERHGIAWHEKKLGQLFCDQSSKQILGLLEDECADAGVTVTTGCRVASVERLADGGWSVATSQGAKAARSLVIATGGLSFPKLGATPFGYHVAKQFGVPLVEPRPGLVPLTFPQSTFGAFLALSGLSIDCETFAGPERPRFRENVLFTHRGLSGPSILQISSLLRPREPFRINLLPGVDALEFLASNRAGGRDVKAVLRQVLPERFVQAWLGGDARPRQLAQLPQREIEALAARLNGWELAPDGDEGYPKAEVTVGGVDTSALSSKTMECREVPGLYFIGEVVDVTGWLGGYNFQWAWASGHAAGEAV
jgi:predicted Rossmann fold flavoprotein